MQRSGVSIIITLASLLEFAALHASPAYGRRVLRPTSCRCQRSRCRRPRPKLLSLHGVRRAVGKSRDRVCGRDNGLIAMKSALSKTGAQAIDGRTNVVPKVGTRRVNLLDFFLSNFSRRLETSALGLPGQFIRQRRVMPGCGLCNDAGPTVRLDVSLRHARPAARHARLESRSRLDDQKPRAVRTVRRPFRPKSPSSSGLGRRAFTAKTGVRLLLGMPI